MTARHIAAGLIALLVFAAPAGAQTRNERVRGRAGTQNRQGQTQFNTQDRQATSNWYKQQQAHPPVGFRPQDRLSPTLESRLQIGSKLDPRLQKLVHPVPAALNRRLAAPAPSYRYAAIGGHVALIDKQNQVHDVIHVHP
jgi:hypothetical protein